MNKNPGLIAVIGVAVMLFAIVGLSMAERTHINIGSATEQQR